jgi:hypothetical protein
LRGEETLGENTPNPIETLVAEAREHITKEISARTEELNAFEKTLQVLGEDQKKLVEEIDRLLTDFQDRRKKLQEEIERQLNHLTEKSLLELRQGHKNLGDLIGTQLDTVAKYQPPPPPVPVAPLDKLLNSVRNLITATLPEQVAEVLTEEAGQLGVRAAVFDVRGKAAWGASARGFDASLSEKTFRALVVPLNQDNPFREAFDTGGSVNTNADLLKKNRNILEKFKPGPNDSVLLMPIRSAGSVSSIFYADTGGKESPLPIDALKILSEFAGAQLDRLMALSGGGPAEAVEEAPAVDEQPQEQSAAPEVAQTQAAPAKSEPREAEPATSAPAPVTTAPAEDSRPAPVPATPAAVAIDLSQLSEEEQKYYKDAKRFAKLLVSEIDLYNKTKVADGRKNKDLYKRLKSDIDRSRLTFQKRFSKPMSPRVDYFHEELVRTLAINDSALLGPDYPGPVA